MESTEFDEKATSLSIKVFSLYPFHSNLETMSSRVTTARGRRRGRGDGTGFEEWGGYMPAKISKLEDQFDDGKSGQASLAKKTSDIFNGIAIFVNGYTNPTSDELKKLMMEHGGKYHHYYQRTKVTHIIATNLCNSKIKPDSSVKVIKPQWITDSVRVGKLLPYQKYRLFVSKSQGTLGFKASEDDSKTNQESYPQSEQELENNIDELENNVDESSKYLHSYHNIEDTDPVLSTLKESSEQQELAMPLTDDTVSKQNELSETICNTSIPQPSTTLVTPSSSKRSSTENPNFVAEFYNNSRLHYLSTWGAEFRAYVNQLQVTGDTSFPGRQRLQQMFADSGSQGTSGTMKRCIMHVDMDCFFVSVGLRSRQHLLGKPVAVTHSKGKSAAERPGTDVEYEKAHWRKNTLKVKKGPGKGDSVKPNDKIDDGDDQTFVQSNAAKPTSPDFNSMAEIASCSYEARKAGVKNGMFMGRAKQLCPDLITIPYDFEGYNHVSRMLYDTVASYTHDIEAVSCDEMLVDLTDLIATTGVDPLKFAQILRQEIKEKTGCNASAGLGPNILMAKLSTRRAKPNGQHLVNADESLSFIKDKPIRDLPGVGWALSNKLQVMGVESCGDLQRIPLGNLQRDFGTKTGQSLYNSCRGLDERPIKVEKERKSVSAEINYGIRFSQANDVEKFILELSGEVQKRLQKISIKGKTVTLKLKIRSKDAPKETAKFMGHGICDNITKSSTLPLATDDPNVIAKECMSILKPLKIPPEEFRGVGIQLSRLEKPAQQPGARQKGLQSILSFTRPQSSTDTDDTSISRHPNTSFTNESVDFKKEPAPSIQQGKKTDLERMIEKGSRASHGNQLKELTSTDLDSSYVENSLVANAVNETQGDFRNLCDKEENMECDLPPLPMLPSSQSSLDSSLNSSQVSGSVSPVFGQSPGEREGASTPQPGPSARPREEDLFMPSPSQIDPTVLSELPAEIRDEIQRSMANSRKKPKPPAQTTVPPAPVLRIEPPSTDTVTSKDEAIVALPSFSQIDPSCLEALPADMRKELEDAYRREREKSRPKSPPPENKESQQNQLKLKQASGRSPGKSPGKTRSSPRKSPKQFKVPRGRPPKSRTKLSPKKLVYSTKTEISVKPKPNNEPRLEEPEPEVQQEAPSTSDIPSGDELKQPNLCGAVSLPDVKDLLNKWMDAVPDPEECDIDEVLGYLSGLVEDHNLEQVDLVLKFLYRCWCRHGNLAGWEAGLKTIVAQTQAFVHSLYGAKLRITFAL